MPKFATLQLKTRRYMSENFTAKDILKKKGYNIELKFYIEDFAEAIKEKYTDLDESAKILVVPKRFIELNNPPECGFFDIVEWGFNGFNLEKEIGNINCNALFAVADDYCDNAIKAWKERYGFKVKKLRNGNYEIMLA